MRHKLTTFNPISLNKEIKILKELEIPDYEIDYLLHLKEKQELEAHWE